MEAGGRRLVRAISRYKQTAGRMQRVQCAGIHEVKRFPKCRLCESGRRGRAFVELVDDPQKSEASLGRNGRDEGPNLQIG